MPAGQPASQRSTNVREPVEADSRLRPRMLVARELVRGEELAMAKWSRLDST